MKTFLFIFLTSYAVSCDDSYYVIRMPEVLRSSEFKVYWNVPTMQCKSKKILFDDLFEKYGIIQNTDDIYRGDKIAILYDPGNFPALITNVSTGEIKYRNGGVPQEGNIMDHLQNFKKDVEMSIPDEDFSGIGIIDFESWRPILRQNFGSLTPYKDVSFDIEKQRHWWWKKEWIEEEARRRFDAAGRDFMQTTLSLAKKMRPKALWGYYGYPQCFNRAENSNPEDCAEGVPDENDSIPWLWEESTALFPSVYTSENVTGTRLAAFIRGRIKESERLREYRAPILPYWWLRYRDGGYFREDDLETSFSTFYNSNTSGFIIWGSSTDVNTNEKCINLQKYVANILGPAVAKYTKAYRRLYDTSDDSPQVLFKSEVVPEFDPEYYWVPPENYTSNIEHIVEEELKTKKEPKPSEDRNVLVDMILNRIARFCLTNCDGNKDKKLESPAIMTTKSPFPETITKTVATVTAETTVNDESFSNDHSDASILLNKALIISMKKKANVPSTTNIYGHDINTSELNTNKYFRDIKSTESNLSPVHNSVISFINNTNSIDETSIDRTITEGGIQFNDTSINLNEITTIMPKIDINNTNLVSISRDASSALNLSLDASSANNLSLNDISNASFSSAINSIKLSDTSPPNVHFTTSSTSRPNPIDWRAFYVDSMNYSNVVNDGYGITNDTDDVETTAAVELQDQVVVSVA